MLRNSEKHSFSSQKLNETSNIDRNFYWNLNDMRKKLDLLWLVTRKVDQWVERHHWPIKYRVRSWVESKNILIFVLEYFWAGWTVWWVTRLTMYTCQCNQNEILGKAHYYIKAYVKWLNRCELFKKRYIFQKYEHFSKFCQWLSIRPNLNNHDNRSIISTTICPKSVIE